MTLQTPFDRIQQLIGLIKHAPTEKQIVKFLSKHLDPCGEISGISWMELADDGIFQYRCIAGLRTTMDSNIRVALADDNVVSKSLRLARMQIWDMATMYSTYLDATHKKELSVFPTGLALPLTDRIIIGCALNTSIEELREHMGYFECMRLVLALWQMKIAVSAIPSAQRSEELNTRLTLRQEEVLSLIKAGKTNESIAVILGFSESLIKQETIIIYKKLGVAGRKEIVTSADE